MHVTVCSFTACVASMILLSGCDIAQPAVDDALRSKAKSVITPIVKQNVPIANAEIVSDCIIDNASNSELLDIAKAAIVGVSDDTIQTVVDIAGRPDTVKCIAKGAIVPVSKG